MRVKKSIPRIFFLSTIIAAIFPLIIAVFFTITQDYKNFYEESKEIRENYIDNQKTMLKHEIEKVINLIELERAFIEKYSIDKIKSKIDFQQEILEEIGKIRFGKDGYIFVVNFSGVTLMNDTQRHLIGQDIWNLEDPNGVKVIQEERKAVENPEGDFIHYVWNKPSESIPSPKISFIKGVHDWQWMIGAGFYVDEIDKVIAEKRMLLIRKVKNDIFKIGLVFILLLIFLIIIAKYFSTKIKKSFEVFTQFFKKSEIESVPINIDKLHFPEFKTLSLSANHMIELREKAEEELKKESDRYKSFITVSNTGAWEYNYDTDFLWCSPEYFSMLGRNTKQFDISGKSNLKETWIDLLHPEDRERASSHFSDYLKNGSVGMYENYFRMKHSDGHWVWILSRGSTLHDIKGEITNTTVGTHINITERKQAEEELHKHREHLEELVKERTTELEEETTKLEKSQQSLALLLEDVNESRAELDISNKKLENSNKELEAFAYSVSHDLRAPLRAIDGFTRILMEDYIEKLDDEGKRLGAVIQKNARKMGKLIDELLAFSRLGRAALQFSSIDMKNMAIAIFHEATGSSERKRINFSIADLPDVDGDSNMFRQVWMNLISNAIKFSSKREKAVISITGIQDDEKITYRISDNGAGFDMQYKNKIFDVFQRLHNERDFAGTGVGLALVRRIINRHNGKIWAESEVDKGATFYFSLPKKVK